MELTIDTNLKLILKNLTFEQKGKLFDMLLEQSNETTDEEVKNFYEYIEEISIKKQTKKTKMKELGLLGSKSRWKNKLTSNTENIAKETSANSNANSNADSDANANANSDANADANSDANANANSNANSDANSAILNKRKETKENINNLNNINNFILNTNENQKNIKRKYKIPTLDEVKQYIKANSFNVDAESFIDFYESRGWCVGKSEIKNWQATVRMWHRRSQTENLPPSPPPKEDEQYWHELKEKYWVSPLSTPPPKDTNTYPELTSHFARFIKRIEDNDLTP